jgi:hypothetical protein
MEKTQDRIFKMGTKCFIADENSEEIMENPIQILQDANPAVMALNCLYAQAENLQEYEDLEHNDFDNEIMKPITPHREEVEVEEKAAEDSNN